MENQTNSINTKNIDFNKDPSGLVPAIIQDVDTLRVLMLGYMNLEAVEETIKTGKVTFYSRSKQRLWTKGEESGHFLLLKDIKIDCDSDALLIRVNPVGPTCHKGNDTCWNEENILSFGFISQLEKIIESRLEGNSQKSYIRSLGVRGLSAIAQKVGEEANETVIASLSESDDRLINEVADLLFHLLILLKKKGLDFVQIEQTLRQRNKN